MDYDEAGRWLVLTRRRLRIVASLGAGPARLQLGGIGTALLAASRPEITIDRDMIMMPGAAFAVVST